MPRRRARPTRSAQGNSWFLWTGVVLLAGGLGWLWWEAAYPTAAERLRSVDAPKATPQPPPSSKQADTLGVPPEMPSFPPTNAPPARVSITVTSTPGVLTSAPTVGVSSPDNVLSAQLALARRGISCGSLDGVLGSQTRAAIRIFQRLEGLPPSGQLDPPTRQRLEFSRDPFVNYRVTADDLARLTPVPTSWFGKSTRERLDFETVLELVAEKFHAHPTLIQKLNPGMDWSLVQAGTLVRAPDAILPEVRGRAAWIRINLGEKSLRVFDGTSNQLGYFPCSIARRVEKRPIGSLRIEKLALNPNYRFDPGIFPESAEARTLNRRLTIPPGPNNPVGTAWIGLSRPGYGIHGTPEPENVGRTESHGCFRLSNWNAEYVLSLAWVGMPVYIDP